MTPYQQIQEKIETLRQQLLTSHPAMPMLLRDIHRQLKSQPEVVTILSEEEIKSIIQGLSICTGKALAETAVKKKASGAKLKTYTAEDL